MPRPSIHADVAHLREVLRACPDPRSFEMFIRQEFLAKHRTSEAAREVLAFAKETSLANAVNLAIESLPTAKSKVLRRLVDGYLPWCQTKLAHDIWKAATPYVESFAGEWFDVVNPYQGKIHVQLHRAWIGSPYPEHPKDGDPVFMTVRGDYRWKDDPAGESQTQFAIDIYVKPNLDIELRGDPPSKLDYAPKEMVRGLKSALER